ncbi:CUB and LDLa domain [Calliopsis andreniformis]|uniref:CUB and LDLa domain n=1 Tax=Calliopsis andreniformis TaxID=337506 RepID=UPI003FCE6AC4
MFNNSPVASNSQSTATTENYVKTSCPLFGGKAERAKDAIKMLYTIIRRYGQNVSFPRRKMCRRARCAILAILWWSIAAKAEEGNVMVRNEDICGVQNGRRLYLELGEKGILYAKNVSFATNEARQDGSPVYASNSSHAQCSLELVTCPSCVIIVTFQSIALSHHCGDGSVTMDSPCRCDYVWISEPPYEDVSGTPFCGLYAPITYRSSTRTLSITLLYSQSHQHAFTLEYTAERNRLHLRGTELAANGQAAKGLNSTGGGIITSPFFPARYPRDLGLEYVVTCPSEAPACRIRLLFSDFQLATVSIMEFYDWNGQRLDVSSGARFRPPVIMSSGPSLLMRFYANGGTGLGYKAFYSFVIGHAFDKSVQPITDCGGYVENLGGAITMMDMVGEGVKTYDCVWLIRPPKNFLHMKTHMYLKVVAFADMAGNTELTVKQGPTSALLPLEILRHPASQVQPPRHREHIAPVTSGFHVSLRGTFGPSSHLAIAYAAFSYMDCFAGSDFLCRNHRCIPSELNCDGFDHCGDNSDEPTTCFRDWEVEPQDRKWHSNKANYYFPKIDRYPDLKTATLVFVASSLGLIMLISALIILLYRMGARARQQRELQSRLQTISELLDGARIDEISVQDDPPVYEAPPGYDEVVKLGLDSEIVGRKKRRGFNREPRSRSSPSQSCSLDVSRSSGSSTTEAASSSHDGSRSIPSANTENTSRNHAPCLPESPPPPYVTPPHSMSRNFSVPGLATISSAHESEDSPDDPDSSRLRRDWYRRTGHFSLSLTSSSEQPSSDSLRRASFSVDAELFGAYLRNRDAPSSICTADASCDSQPRISRAASIGTGPESVEREGVASVDEGTSQVARRQEDTGRRAERRTEQGPEAGAEATSVEGDVKTQDSVPACSCEGACGCATTPTDEATHEAAPLWPSRASAEQSNEPDAEKEMEDLVREDREEDDASTSTSTVVRLLGSRAGKWQTGSAGSTTASTPCGTLRRSARKFSARSRDACRISSMGSTSSYEKLSNSEFEFARRAIHSSDSAAICSAIQRRRAMRYASCDLESLYEGIKVLDGFLARRGVTTHGRKQSVTVMLFGTPAHGARRRSPDDEEAAREDTRASRFSLEAPPSRASYDAVLTTERETK